MDSPQDLPTIVDSVVSSVIKELRRVYPRLNIIITPDMERKLTNQAQQSVEMEMENIENSSEVFLHNCALLESNRQRIQALEFNIDLIKERIDEMQPEDPELDS